MLEPVGFHRCYTDSWGVSRRHLDPPQQVAGTRAMQPRERNPLLLRTRGNRVVSNPMCFSTSLEMHELVIGLSLNRLEFGPVVECEEYPLNWHMTRAVPQGTVSPPLSGLANVLPGCVYRATLQLCTDTPCCIGERFRYGGKCPFLLWAMKDESCSIILP